MGVDGLYLVGCDGASIDGNLYQAAALTVLPSDYLPDTPNTVALVLPKRVHDAKLHEVDLSSADAICVGGETHGLPRLKQAQRVAIPMFGKQPEHTVEAALSIALWEWRKQCLPLSKSSFSKTVAVDFDDTICRMVRPFRRYAYGEPIAGAGPAIASLRDCGYRVIVHTARDHREKTAILAHLDSHGIDVDAVVCGKPPAVVYVDDRAIHFDGDWKRTLAEWETRL
jgi:hypothetical protein